MKRDTVAAVVLAIGGILALAVAGATIEDLREEGEGGVTGAGEGSGGVPEVEGDVGGFDVSPVISGELVMMILLTLMVILLLIYLIRNWNEALPYVVVAILIFVGLALFFHFVPLDLNYSPIQDELEFNQTATGEEAVGGGGTSDPPAIGDWFPVYLLLGGAAVLLVAISVLTTRGGGSEPAPTEEESTGTTPDMTAELGAAAGRAADRLEADTGRENEVYRAWIEMIELLDVGDPQSATPGAFAREASKSGLAAEDVADLTELFEEVRYGDRPANERREREAVELLRRIEDRYATEAES